jgi:hypothetical protein
MEVPSAPSPSLYNDLATFISAAATVFSQHPELSEGLKNIIANATNGTYLGPHAANIHQDVQRGVQQAQEQVSRNVAEAQRFAEQVHQSTAEAQRVAQELTNRRVQDALGGIFNAFTGTAAAPETTHQEPNPQPTAAAEIPSRNDDTRSTRERFSWSASRDRSGYQPRTPFGHALSSWLDNVVPPTPGMQPPVPPQVPLPPRPPMPPTVPSPLQHRSVLRPPIPQPPMGPFKLPLGHQASVNRRGAPPPSQPAGPRRQSANFSATPSAIPTVATLATSPASAPNPQTVREELEESKKRYKAAKAAYRAEREARHRRDGNISGDRFVSKP